MIKRSVRRNGGGGIVRQQGWLQKLPSGPYFDQRFHGVGLHPDATFFIGVFDVPGHRLGSLPRAITELEGAFSDSYDGRQEKVPPDSASSAFRRRVFAA
jgi:hypothetical protein